MTSASPAQAPSPQTLYLIDGSGFIFRAYHALPPLTNAQGTPVGAVLGFVNMINKLMEGNKASHAAVIFDAARKTFRNRIYADYKAHRPPAPDDLIPQFPLVRHATEALSLPAIELEDYEADDIIATYAKQARAQGMEVIIVSSDKDLMQLIAEGVSMFDAMKQKTIGAEQVMEKFGVAPEKVRDVLALIGDSSDNVPGVPGIGPKTAAELVLAFGDLASVLERCAEVKQNKRRELLQQHCEQARLSYELIGLKDDVPGLMPIEDMLVRQPDPEKLFPFLEKHGLKSALARMKQKFGDSGSGARDSGKNVPISIPKEIGKALSESRISNPGAYSLVRDEETLKLWLARAKDKGAVAFDTETNSLDAMQADLIGFSLCAEQGEACYVPLQHVSAEGSVQANIPDGDLFSQPKTSHLVPGQIPLARALALMKPLLEDESVLKIGHNIKYDMLVMRTHGIDIHPIADSMIVSYLLHAGEHGQGMDELAERYLGYKTISFDEVTGTGKSRVTFDKVDLDKACAYAAEDADITLRLYETFLPQLQQAHMLTLYETIERPLIGVLARMEEAGVKIDMPKLAGLSKDFETRMRALEIEICGHAGCEFNVGSPKQLGEVLFDRLQLPGGKKSSKTGAYGTDNYVLEELAEEGHAIAQKVIEWRQISKLKSTYSDALAEQIDPKTQRVHTNFAMAIASTGRLSSNNPNLQNIPIRTEEGRKIREAFIAEPGYTLVSADYSQIELRLLAHFADIPSLKEAFKEGKDIHAITASQILGIPLDQVDANARRSAKTINFGIIYGMSAHGLASRLGISRSEAGAYIERYFTQYPGIPQYMDRCKIFAREHGYVETLFGRRCHLPGITDKNGARRQFSERAAINAPLQGTAADIIKKAMVAIDREIQGPDIRMLLQVHDELVFEVKQERLGEAQTLIQRAMEQAVRLSVPLVVDIGSGSHWGEAH